MKRSLRLAMQRNRCWDWRIAEASAGTATITYSPIAQSVERMTVNHDAVGSSPTGGAIRKDRQLFDPSFPFTERVDAHGDAE